MIKIAKKALIVIGSNPAGRDLCQKVDWPACHIARIYQADDKRSALAVFNKLQPQLVVIGLDPVQEAGLEFFFKIKMAAVDCAIILFSAQPGLILPGQAGFGHLQAWLSKTTHYPGPGLDLLPGLVSIAQLALAKKAPDNKALWAAKIKKYVWQNYMDCELNITSIAETFKLGAPYVGTLFKQTEAISLVQYIMQYRCQAAIRLLADPDLKIHQISRLVGMADPNYFARCFKKIIGLSPKEYRIQTLIRRIY